jgi:hypothetical protein
MFVLVRQLRGKDAFYSYRKAWDSEWSYDRAEAVEMSQEEAQEKADYFLEEISVFCQVRPAN